MLGGIKPYKIFKDLQLERDVCKEGYKVVDTNNNIDYEEINKFINDLSLDDYLRKYSTFLSIYINDINYRTHIQNSICNQIFNLVEDYFVDYEIRATILIIKPPNSLKNFPVHQDPSICDENKFSSLNLWIPLLDTNKNNGTLKVKKKSHKKFNVLRGESIPKSKYSFFDKCLLTNLNVKKGEFVVFDPRTLHASGINTASTPRNVIFVSLVNKNAPFKTPVLLVKKKKIWMKNQPKDYFNICNDFYNCHIDGFSYYLNEDDLIRQDTKG